MLADYLAKKNEYPFIRIKGYNSVYYSIVDKKFFYSQKVERCSKESFTYACCSNDHKCKWKWDVVSIWHKEDKFVLTSDGDFFINGTPFEIEIKKGYSILEENEANIESDYRLPLYHYVTASLGIDEAKAQITIDEFERFLQKNLTNHQLEILKYKSQKTNSSSIADSMIISEDKVIQLEKKAMNCIRSKKQYIIDGFYATLEKEKEEAERRASEAESRASEAEQRASEAEQRASKAERVTVEAKRWAKKVEKQRIEVEAQWRKTAATTSKHIEEKIIEFKVEADMIVNKAEQKVKEAECRAKKEEEKRIEAEIRANKAEHRAEEAERHLEKLKRRTQETEKQITSFTNKVFEETNNKANKKRRDFAEFEKHFTIGTVLEFILDISDMKRYWELTTYEVLSAMKKYNIPDVNKWEEQAEMKEKKLPISLFESSESNNERISLLEEMRRDGIYYLKIQEMGLSTKSENVLAATLKRELKKFWQFL